MITPFTLDTDGVFFGLPAETYHASPGVSQSTLKKFASEPTPKHFVESLTRKFEPTPAMEFGTVCHSALFEPDSAPAYRVQPVTYKDEKGVEKPWHNGAKVCKDWNAANAGKIIITQEQCDSIPKIVASVRRNERFSALLDSSQREVSFFKRDKETGLMLKCRVDCLAMDADQRTFIGDLKTTSRGGASEEEFQFSVEKLGYDIQAASYLHITGASNFVFCVAEVEPPYESVEYDLDERYLKGGLAKYRAILKRYAECMKSGEWPGYQGARVLTPSRFYKETI